MFECKRKKKKIKHVSRRFVYCSCAAKTCSKQSICYSVGTGWSGCKPLLEIYWIGFSLFFMFLFFWKTIKISFVNVKCLSSLYFITQSVTKTEGNDELKILTRKPQETTALKTQKPVWFDWSNSRKLQCFRHFCDEKVTEFWIAGLKIDSFTSAVQVSTFKDFIRRSTELKSPKFHTFIG